MTIDHVAIWTTRLEQMKDFYVRCFGCAAGPKYTNPTKQFASYFLRFETGSRLELMQKQSVADQRNTADHTGYAHIAISVGSEDSVRRLTEHLRATGVAVVSEPRRTGDGCFESAISDPDGNVVEITI